MEKVRFIESVKVRDDEGREFKAGKEYDLPAASARRWIVRGKAELVAPVAGEAAGNATSLPQDDDATLSQGNKRRNTNRAAQ